MRLVAALSLSILIHLFVIVWPFRGLDADSEPRLQFPVRSISVHLPRTIPLRSSATDQVVLVSRASHDEYQGQGSVDATSSKKRDMSRYFLASELDQRPAAVDFFNLDDSEISLNVSGSVIIQFWVNEMGKVDIMEIEQSTIPEEVARRLLNERFAVRFEAGKKNHSAVKSIVRYRFDFLSEAQRRETESRQSRSVGR